MEWVITEDFHQLKKIMSDEEINPEVFQIIQSVLGDLSEEDTKILIESLKKETEEDNRLWD